MDAYAYFWCFYYAVVLTGSFKLFGVY